MTSGLGSNCWDLLKGNLMSKSMLLTCSSHMSFQGATSPGNDGAGCYSNVVT